MNLTVEPDAICKVTYPPNKGIRSFLYARSYAIYPWAAVTDPAQSLISPAALTLLQAHGAHGHAAQGQSLGPVPQIRKSPQGAWLHCQMLSQEGLCSHVCLVDVWT